MPVPRRPKIGRPAALEALRHGNTRRAAAAMAGVTERTLYRWIEADVTFSQAVERAEGEAEAMYLAAVEKAVPDSWQAAAWWLERRKHTDYSRRDKVDMSVDVKREAERIAAANGLDVSEVLAEADRVLADGR
jgi:hypothetical protein